MMDQAAGPRFRDLTQDEIREILARNRVGRLAFSFRDHVEIQPLHYVFDREWLFGRTSDGEKLASLRHNWWVAFGVDEVEGPFDWRSVMVRGGFYRLDTGGPPDTRVLYDRAMACIRRVMPDALTDEDPVPFRTVVFGVAVQHVSGRVATTAI